MKVVAKNEAIIHICGGIKMPRRNYNDIIIHAIAKIVELEEGS